MPISQLTQFLGCCTLINFGFLFAMALAMTWMRGPIYKIHSSMFGISEAELPRLYLQLAGGYKMAILIFNLVPFLVLEFLL